MLTIREATKADIPVLRQLEQGVVDYERPFNPQIQANDVIYYDLDDLIVSDNSMLALVEDEGVIVGTGYAQIRPSKPYFLHEHHCYLGFMYVASDYRGQGINARIMESLLGWSKAKGIANVYLDVYAENESAIRAYEKIGFKPSMLEMQLDIK